MTNQEIFDKAVSHLRKQGKKSVGYVQKNGPSPACRYRLEKDGEILMCAAGIFIKDEDYCEALEGNSITNDIVRNIFLSNGFDDRKLYLIERLQSIHDEYEVEDWESRFERLAEELNLRV